MWLSGSDNSVGFPFLNRPRFPTATRLSSKIFAPDSSEMVFSIAQAVVYHASLLISTSSASLHRVRTCGGGGSGGLKLGRVGQTSVNYGGRKTFTALPRRKASLFFPFLLRVPGDTYTYTYIYTLYVFFLYHSPRNPKSICFSSFRSYSFFFFFYILAHFAKDIRERWLYQLVPSPSPFIPLLLSHSPGSKKKRTTLRYIRLHAPTRNDLSTSGSEKHGDPLRSWVRVCSGYMSKSITLATAADPAFTHFHIRIMCR